MLMYVVDSLDQCGVQSGVIVVGHKAEWVQQRISSFPSGFPLSFVEQPTQRGTGDAAAIGISGLDPDHEDDDVVIMPGDQPLFRPETLAAVVAQHRASGFAATVVTARIGDPTGLGRVVMNRDGVIAKIVEHRDASPEELLIDEINTSVYCFRRALLAPALRRIVPNNAQGEYYLTDVIEVLAAAGHRVGAFRVADPSEAVGINDRQQLAAAESVLRRRVNESLLRNGVTMWDPGNTFVDATVTVGRDVTLLPGVVLQGDTSIGDGCEIGPNCRLVDTEVGARSTVQFTVAQDAVIPPDSIAGPFEYRHGPDTERMSQPNTVIHTT